MKPVLCFILGGLLSATQLGAVAPAPAYHALAVELATQFLTGEENSDEQFDAFARVEEIEGDGFQNAVKEAIRAGRVVIDRGTPAASKHFRRILADTLGVAPRTVAGGSDDRSAVKERPHPVQSTPVAEVLADDEAAYAELQLDEKRLSSVLAAAGKAYAAAKPDSLERRVAERKRDVAQVALEDNRAKQVLLRSNKAAAERKTAAARNEQDAAAQLASERAEQKVSVAQTAVDALAEKLAGIEIPEMSNAGPVSFIHGGVRLLSPYKFRYDASAGKGYLDKAGSTDTVTFLEYVYGNRVAWSPLALAEGEGRRDGFKAVDVEFRLNYNLSSADSDASAIAGSGDFGVEVSINYPWQGLRLHDADDWRMGGWTIGPELSYGVTTDRSAFSAHQRVFLGAGYTMSYNLNGAETRWLLLQARLGLAEIDTVKFVSDTTHEVEITRGDLPRYRFQDAIAFEADVIYPLSRDSHLTFGGRIYAGPRPSSWTLYLGYTRSIADIAKAIFPNFGEKESTGGAAGTAKKAAPDKAATPANPSL